VTTTTAHRQRRFLLSLLTLLTLAGATFGPTIDASATTRPTAETRVRANNHPTAALVATDSHASSTGVRVSGPDLRQSVSATGVATEAVVDDLAAAANRASATMCPGKGPVYGTRVHSEFADEIASLGRSDVFSEVSYLNGEVVPYGTRGSVRLDAVVGSPGAPSAIYDLKTGSAALTPARIAQIRANLPAGFQDVPVLELRPR